MNLPTPADIRRAKLQRQKIAEAIRNGEADWRDYGLDAAGLLTGFGPIEPDGTRRVRPWAMDEK